MLVILLVAAVIFMAVDLIKPPTMTVRTPEGFVEVTL